MKYYYFVVEFTNDRAQVMTDWFKATNAINAAKQALKEYAGVVYTVDGPFKSEGEAIEELNNQLRSTTKQTEG